MRSESCVVWVCSPRKFSFQKSDIVNFKRTTNMARGAEAKQRKKEKKANAKANGEEVSGGKVRF